MGLAHSPRTVVDGLVLSLDVANQKSYTPDKNLINPGTWVAGSTGTQTGFTQNGLASENSIIVGADPFGNQANLWESAPGGDGAADGGWNGTQFTIDSTKMYRFSVWVNRTVTGANGHVYLGLYGYNAAGSNIGVLNRGNGANSTNPYFWVSSTPPTQAQLTTNEWTLIVAHVHPAGSGTGNSHPNSGLYTISGGKKNITVTDYVWNTENARTMHRSYLYYSGDTTVRQRWAYPRVDVVDGTEPSIDDLLQNKVNNLYLFGLTDRSPNTLRNGPTYSSNNSGILTLDGANDFIQLPIDDAFNTPSVTFDVWCNLQNRSNRHILMVNWQGNSLEVNAGGGVQMYNYSSSGQLGAVSSSGAISWGAWCNVVGSYDDSTNTLSVYVNGQLKATASAPSTVYNVAVHKISGTDYGGQILGSVAIARHYNRALTAEEVKQNFNALRGRFGI